MGFICESTLTAGASDMNGIMNWFNTNIDKKQMLTIVAASVAVGGLVYGAKVAGLGQVATVVKGG
jgi:hypothetical protein